MIRPVYFYYAEHTESFESIRKHIPTAEHVSTQSSSYAYWDELAKRWDGTADLLTLEQHIVVHDQVMPQLEACDGDWCVFPASGQMTGLGCTRFSAALQQQIPVPLILSKARRKCPHCGAPHYAFIDGPIMDAMTEVGRPLTPCWHEPPVDHLPA